MGGGGPGAGASKLLQTVVRASSVGVSAFGDEEGRFSSIGGVFTDPAGEATGMSARRLALDFRLFGG